MQVNNNPSSLEVAADPPIEPAAVAAISTTREESSGMTPTSRTTTIPVRLSLSNAPSPVFSLPAADPTASTSTSTWRNVPERPAREQQPEYTLKTEAEIKAIPQKRIRKYYRNQNKLLARYEEAELRLQQSQARHQKQLQQVELEQHQRQIEQHQHQMEQQQQHGDIEMQNVTLPSKGNDDQSDRSLAMSIREEGDDANAPPWARWAVIASFYANLALFVLKILATVQSGSLSVLAAAIDSALDLLSGSILFITQRIISRAHRDLDRFPVGKARYENVGIIVFASIMGTAALQIILESVRSLVQTNRQPLDVTTLTFAVLGTVIAVKFVLLLWCWKMSPVSLSCAALAQDHFNDVCTNAFSTVMVAIAGQFTSLWWLDPVGAILFSLYIIFSWVRTGHYHMNLLAGKRADPQLLSQLTYFAAHFHSDILQVDTVRAYHVGRKVFCELDIILAPEMSLKDAHDIGEDLQHGLESFPNVERAFVHCDYEGQHFGEHKPI